MSSARWKLAAWTLVLAAGCAEEAHEEAGAPRAGSPVPTEPAAGPTAAPEPEASPDAWFREEARERGLDFVHRSGHDGSYLFPEIMCGGAALVDVDADGDLDAYLVQSGDLRAERDDNPPNRLYANDGAGRFAARDRSGAGDRGYGMGVATGDADGDGTWDLYVTNVGPNALLLGSGDGTFTDATESAGVGAPGWSTSAAFLDLDRDGDLDLFCVNYVLWSVADEETCETPPYGRDYCSPRVYRASAPDVLYRNEGAGAFTDVSFEAGIRSAFGNGLGVVCSDVDGDGWTDVFVANDANLNQLWMNRRDGTLEDRAVLMGVAADEHGTPKAGMGVDAADVDGDGDEDLLVVNLGQQSDSYYRNDGEWFSDRTARAGLAVASRSLTRFGCAFEDLDRDGLLDLYLATGRVTRALHATTEDPYAERDLVLRGTGPGSFERLAPELFAPPLATSRAAAFGDVDGDGGVDVLVANRDLGCHLFVNRVPRPGASVRARLVDERGLDVLGARLDALAGERRVTRTVRTARSYLAASDPGLALGLGGETGLREVRVTWPDGTEERFEDVPAGGTVTLRRGTGRMR